MNRCATDVKDHRCQPRLLYPGKLSIIVGGKNNIVYDKTKFKQYLFIKPALQNMLEESFQPKEVNCTTENIGNK